MQGLMRVIGTRSASLVGASINEPTVVINGQLRAAHKVYTDSIKVNGGADCTGCTFKAEVVINGYANLSGDKFESDLEIAGQANFKRTTAKLVRIVSHYSGYPGTQRVDISEHTTIEKLVFAPHRGVVHASRDSVVSEIVNGKIVYKN